MTISPQVPGPKVPPYAWILLGFCLLEEENKGRLCLNPESRQAFEVAKARTLV